MNHKKNTLDFVSIIVPVFNVEKYLRATIDSIINQTHKNWELVLVDDGSTDFSGNICEEYAKKDDRIKVYHIKNGGVSRARNFALDRCNGEYIVFCDSDDMIAPQMLESLHKILLETNSDIVKCETFFIQENDLIYRDGEVKNSVTLFKGNSLCELSSTFYHVVWGKMYKANLINDNYLRFDEGLNRGEDTLFAYQSVLCSKKISTTSSQLVNYRLRDNSLMRSEPSKSLFLQSCHKYSALVGFAEKHEINETVLEIQKQDSLMNILCEWKKASRNKYDFQNCVEMYWGNILYKDALYIKRLRIPFRLQLTCYILRLTRYSLFIPITRFLLR